MKCLSFCFFLLITLLSFTSTASEKTTVFKNYDFKNFQQIKITSKLKEISGLANSNDGNLFAINDETGIVYKLNPLNGDLIKRFFLGRWTAEADFEGIATTEQFIYAISSNGKLYKFEEGINEQSIEYEVKNLPFSSKFDIEGLYHDIELNGLLITPKEYAGKNYKGKRSIYFFSIKDAKVVKEPLITISLKKLKKEFNVKDFYPSGITKHPKTGNYLIVSARGDNVIVEVDRSGNIVGTQKLKESVHRQPEGITVLADYSLLISDEAAGKKPTITIYKYKE
jgi:uncharacterized protein YjiK